MIYTVLSPKVETLPRHQLRGKALLALGLALSGCASMNPVTVFHRYEGGAIAHNPPPPPGLDEPYPNLASVPPKPPPLSPRLQRSIRGQLEAANTSQNALSAPAGGVAHPSAPQPPATPRAKPVLIRFRPGKAILPRSQRAILRALAARRGAADIAAIGFAPRQTPAGLNLAMLRATAIANELVRAGVPASAIRIEALSMGRGGAAQLIYASAPQPAQSRT
ncbi:hypothetical protein AiwAL_15875 [Acidiphilium sp. AL]|uniref:OmpA-like domain-containing protein n=1 Tax=Acidiphilium iwatense TaxID=768198 RepID=A0ABS9DYF0_9PROT|nr:MULTISPECIES: hypothetical protein [Acidiphilium]MCF3947777.1 hypothetical protein [Acidiphilium iwatense]MCU4161562.1 hypothetical protein [Acidiphilium sp. AL]